MIQFPCPNCRHVFSVADDEAGNSIQCPRCGRLNDVPLHSDLHGIAEDGTFKLSSPAGLSRPAPDQLADTTYVFQKGRVDDEGNEIDLRNTPEDLSGLDQPAPAMEPGQRQRYKPQYDPETGELIRPLDLAPDPVRDLKPQDIPLAAVVQDPAKVIEYARKGDAELRTRSPIQRLTAPENLAVMTFVLIFLVIGAVLQLFFILPAAVFHLPAWPFNFIFWLVVAHFGNTVVEVGPEETDELPRPLKSLGFWDDILAPMLRVLMAVLICYAPAFFVLAAFDTPATYAALPLMFIGGFFFPAVVLTTTASGSLLNLQPARVMNVIRIGGQQYWRLVLVWVICFPVYLWATVGVDLIGSAIGVDLGDSKFAGHIIITFSAAVLSVFFMHYFFWNLGLLYRAGHDRFGWVWQEHVRQREQDLKRKGALTAADRAAMRKQRQLRSAGNLPPSRTQTR